MSFKEDAKDVGKRLIPGAIGGAVGTMATMPLDVTKDLMKTWKAKGTPAEKEMSKSFVRTFRHILKTQGPKGLFTGWGPSMGKIVPSMALTFAVGDAIKNRLEKKAEDTTSDKVKKVLTTAAIPTLLGAAAFAKFRKPAILTRNVAKKSYTIITDYNKKDYNLLKARSGASSMMTIDEAMKVKKPISGTVYFDTEQASLKGKNIPLAPGTKVYNRTDLIDKVFQDKAVFGKLKTKHGVPTKTLKEHLRGKAFNTPEELGAALVASSKKGPLYFKPRREFASGGATHTHSGKLERQLAAGQTSKVLKSMHANPHEYIVQPRLDIEINPKTGKPASEHRVHVVSENGRIRAVGSAMPRWDKKLIFRREAETVHASDVEKAMKHMVRDNPKLKAQLKGKNLLLGVDAVKTKQGKTVLIEANDQSGFAVGNPIMGRSIYKHVTGRDTPTYATAKSLAVAGTALAGQTGIQHMRKTTNA